MIKNRRRRVTDDLLDRILEKLSAKDLLILVKTFNEYIGDKRARRLAWPRTPPSHGGGPGFKSPRAHHDMF
jgi:hypothetical protein